jgi:hypothetical protein
MRARSLPVPLTVLVEARGQLPLAEGWHAEQRQQHQQGRCKLDHLESCWRQE